ncbi:unnamed protein product, partial [Caenorhabditis brenneri]
FLNRSTYASPISVSEQLGPFAPEESWKRTVAPRHAIAYEETCLNMKFAPESFYNEDGLPRPQSVLQEQNQHGGPRKNNTTIICEEDLYIYKGIRKEMEITVSKLSKETMTRAEKRKRDSNPSYEGVEKVYATKRRKTDH